MQLSEKIQSLKGKDFDPMKLANPRDTLNAYMYRWEQYTNAMRAQMTKKGMSERDQENFIGNASGTFYDAYLKPTYDKIGSPAFNRDVWMHNNKDIMSGWNMDKAYSDSRLAYGFKTGLFREFPAMAEHAIASWIFTPPIEVTDENYMHQYVRASQTGAPVSGYFADLKEQEKADKQYPRLSALRKYFDSGGDKYDVLTAMRPAKGILEHTGQFVGSNLPLVALSIVSGGKVGAANVTEDGIFMTGAILDEINSASLTESMISGARAAGRIGTGKVGDITGWLASSSLEMGIDGAKYGFVTRPFNTKLEAWKDALEFQAGVPIKAAATGVGILGKKIISMIGKKVVEGDYEHLEKDARAYLDDKTKGQLPAPPTYVEGEYVGEPPTPPQDPTIIDDQKRLMAEAFKAREQAQNMLTDGRTPVDAREMEEASEAGVSQVMLHRGKAAIPWINDTAAAHILKMEDSGMNPSEIFKHERELYRTGTPETKEMLDAVMRICSSLGKKTLKDLGTDAKANLLASLQQLTENAKTKAVKYNPELQEALVQRITSLPVAALDQNIMQSLMSDVMKSMPANATKQMFEDGLKQALAKKVLAMHQWSDGQLSLDRIGQVTKAAKLRDAYAQKNPVRGWSEVTRYRKTKSGEPSISYSFNPQWTVYAKNALKARGKKWTPEENSEEIKNWVSDLSEDDFAADIHAYFLPKFLKDINLRFESGNVKNLGKDWTNLWSFALNFKDSMPKAYADRLEEEMLDSPRLAKFYNEIKNNPAISAKEKLNLQSGLTRKLSLSMWNHVDNFLNSGHFPKENHIYRSTSTHWNDPTKWMDQLFKEREQYEHELIDKMFEKNTPANKIAKATLKAVMNDRRLAYKNKEPLKVRMMSEKIKSILTQEGPRGGKSPVLKKVRSPAGDTPQATLETGVALSKYEIGSQIKLREADREFDDIIKAREKDIREAVFHEQALERPGLSEKERAEHETAVKAADERIASYVPKLRDLQNKYGGVGGIGGITKQALAHGAVYTDKLGRKNLWLSDDMFNKLKQVTENRTLAQAEQSGGYNLSGRDIQRNWSLRAIQDDKAGVLSAQDKNILSHLVGEAYKNVTGEGINVMRAGKKASYASRVYGEEAGHGWQRILHTIGPQGRQVVNELKSAFNDTQWEHFNKTMPNAMRSYLNSENLYQNVPTYMKVVEATCKLIVHPPELHNVPEDEAIDYIYDYYDNIVKERGTEALKRLTTAVGFAERLRKEFIAGTAKPRTSSVSSVGGAYVQPRDTIPAGGQW